MSHSKRGKRQQHATPDVSSVRGRRNALRFAVIAAVAFAVFAAYWITESPHAYFKRALRCFPSQPAECEKWAQLAVVKAHGNYPAAQLLQCRALAAMGEWDSALGGFSLIKNTTYCNPEDLLNLGEAALAVREFQLAERALQAARVPGSVYSRATEKLVRLKIEFSMLKDALGLCDEWKKALPSDPMPWFFSAGVKASGLELADAIRDYRTSLELHPQKDVELSIRAALAGLLLHAGDTRGSREQFEILLANRTVSGKDHLNLIQLLRNEGKLGEAITEIERYLAENGSGSEVMKWRGIIRMDLDDLDGAFKDLKNSAELNPYDIGVQNLLGQIYLRLGQPDVAARHMENGKLMTEATFRIAELNILLQDDPSNKELRSELHSLKKIVGK